MHWPFLVDDEHYRLFFVFLLEEESLAINRGVDDFLQSLFIVLLFVNFGHKRLTKVIRAHVFQSVFFFDDSPEFDYRVHLTALVSRRICSLLELDNLYVRGRAYANRIIHFLETLISLEFVQLSLEHELEIALMRMRFKF